MARSESVPRIAAVNTHLEGNLGDEMETTPVLRALHELGYKLDVFTSPWKAPQPNLRVSPRAVRELLYADEIFVHDPLEERSSGSRGARQALLARNYTAYIVMPGPIRAKRLRTLCQHVHALATKPAVLAIGVTINGLELHGAGPRSSARSMQGWQRDCANALVVAREPLTVHNWNALVPRGKDRAARSATELAVPSLETPCPALGSAVLMGDTSFSFQPILSLKAMWRAHYAGWAFGFFRAGARWRALIFHRASNQRYGLNAPTPRAVRVRVLARSRSADVRGGATPELSTAVPLVAPPVEFLDFHASEVAFATSDVDLDTSFLVQLVKRLGLPATRAMLLENVEQMWGLIEAARDAGALVLSDRYHPLVAAHVLGVQAQAIAYPAEAQKIVGINSLLQLPRERMQHLNDRGWRCVREVLASAAQKQGQVLSGTTRVKVEGA